MVLLRSYLAADLCLRSLSSRAMLRNLSTVGYIRMWMGAEKSIDIHLALDHSIQLLYAYYQIPMSGIKISTRLKLTGMCSLV